MKPTFLLLTALLLMAIACRKPVVIEPPSEPSVHVFSLHDQKVRYGSRSVRIDANKDGKTDLVFGVQRVGDPLAKWISGSSWSHPPSTLISL